MRITLAGGAWHLGYTCERSNNSHLATVQCENSLKFVVDMAEKIELTMVKDGTSTAGQAEMLARWLNDLSERFDNRKVSLAIKDKYEGKLNYQ